ncbi:predicted protein [Nematostella vectensis]|uniref:NTR domain-containing protein n=2 Tax=Nematostella vectensis TaxID=45351 RepID=A7SSJ1_NEMVE|nr:predicted protein [Nematostella vectensis]|eukprot:XP_001625448.1 predicted protein [Nematostella vectensis]
MACTVLVFLLAGVMCVAASDDCICASPHGHPQDVFCSSDYALRGLVTSGPKKETIKIMQPPDKPLTRNVLSYIVEIREVYRGGQIIRRTTGLQHRNTTLLLPSEVRITTDDNACAAILPLNTEQLIAGYSDGARLEVFSCNWVEPWGNLTVSQQIAVKRYYGRHCACRTSLCSLLDPLGTLLDFECAREHLYCRLRRDGATCGWRSIGRWYRECVLDIHARNN